MIRQHVKHGRELLRYPHMNNLHVNVDTDFSIGLDRDCSATFRGFVKSIHPNVEVSYHPRSIRSFDVNVVISDPATLREVHKPLGKEVTPEVRVAKDSKAITIAHPVVVEALAFWLESEGHKKAAEAMRKKFCDV